MNKLILVTLFLLFSTAVHAQKPIKFLEEKTAFCYSEQALARYLQHASQRNIQGMNNMVLSGKCDFVPDGKIVRLRDYRIDSIGDTKVVEFEMDNLTVWTFQALVQTTDFSNL